MKQKTDKVKNDIKIRSMIEVDPTKVKVDGRIQSVVKVLTW